MYIYEHINVYIGVSLSQCVSLLVFSCNKCYLKTLQEMLQLTSCSASKLSALIVASSQAGLSF